MSRYMNSFVLTTPAFVQVEEHFTKWVSTLGYCKTNTKGMSRNVREFLCYLEQKRKTQLSDITAKVISDYYYDHLRNRSNIRTKTEALSNGHLNKHRNSLMTFGTYLRQSCGMVMQTIQIRSEKDVAARLTFFTEEEIEQLFEATFDNPRSKYNRNQEVIEAAGQRDRAMLAVYYGCGLRNNEGIQLDVSDVLFDKELLYVREGKNYKERFVPMGAKVMEHLEQYISDGRITLLQKKKSDALFLTVNYSARISTTMIRVRLRRLIKLTGNSELIQKNPDVHSLRHSIATHLLAKGMKLEQIKEFLGHGTLRSTQIYAHLIKDNDTDTYE